jgi:hypothetical protein
MARMGARHKRTWTVVREGSPHRASGYRAIIVKLDSEHTAAFAVNLLDWLTGPSGIVGFEPRYRVLVGRTGTEQTVGVREGRTWRKASQQFDQIDAILADSTEEAAKATLGLDF